LGQNDVLFEVVPFKKVVNKLPLTEQRRVFAILSRSMVPHGYCPFIKWRAVDLTQFPKIFHLLEALKIPWYA